MRLNGTIIKWNDAKGFGFIQPSGGGLDLFFHISEFPSSGGVRPKLGDKITFEVLTGHDGKKKAIKVEAFAQRALTDNYTGHQVPYKEKGLTNTKTSPLKKYLLLFIMLTAVTTLFFPKKSHLREKPIYTDKTYRHRKHQRHNCRFLVMGESIVRK